jgi:tRNA modification GTPase
METIFALATPPGKSGIAVIRISGSKCDIVLHSLGISKLPLARYAKLHKLYHPISQELIDEALIIYFKAPASFTGEDSLELQLHGSRAVIAEIFDAFSHIKGLRMARAGEFSFRAFENGKMDLTQSEALIDLIDAETKMQHLQALRQMSGSLKNLYQQYRHDILKALSLVEAYIDFPDEDIPEDIKLNLKQLIDKTIIDICAHLNDKNRGEKLRHGIYVTIIGATNAGKSSLLNLLAKRDIAIVSDIAGTTRDVLEVKLDIAGYPFIVSDTAGIRATRNKIEQEGITRALASANQADLKIAIFDASQKKLHQATLDLIDENTIVLFNKIDLTSSYDLEIIKNIKPLGISVHLQNNIDLLLEHLRVFAQNNFSPASDPIITRARHRQHLMLTLEHLERFNLDMPIELAGEELRLSAEQLGKIMGKITVDEILGEIFSNFCIGK